MSGWLEGFIINIMAKVIYGWFENGCLRTVELDDRIQRFNDENGVQREITVSVDHYIEIARAQGLKPVDPIDQVRMETHEEDYVVLAKAVEYPDRIGWSYRDVPDLQKLRKQIRNLQDEIASTDYRVIKCYEASLVGDPVPYDIQELRTSRQAIRDRINALEYRIAELTINLD